MAAGIGDKGFPGGVWLLAGSADQGESAIAPMSERDWRPAGADAASILGESAAFDAKEMIFE